ncbi:MAG: 30S ribosomal protein S19 [Patescibacteria group bacterium]
MSRSLKKGPFLNEKLMKKVARAKATADRTPIKTWARASTITPDMVGMRFGVHNGKDFIDVLVDENMVGHKLGEFSPTRKFVRHGGKIQKAIEQGVAAKGSAAIAAAAAPDKSAAPKKK